METEEGVTTEIDAMKCVELKDELKIRGLCTTGNKSKLVERLKAAILVEQARVEGNIDKEEEDDSEEEEAKDDSEEEEAEDDNVEEEEDDKVEEDEEDIYENGASTKFKHQNQVKRPTVQLTVKDVEELLEKFSGNGYPSIQNWVRDFDEMAALYQWNDLEKVTFAKRLLQGTAKRYVSYEKCARTWAKLKKALLEEFGEIIDSIQIHRELSKRQKLAGESFQDYIYVMMEIASQGDVEQRSVVQYIIEGIPDEAANKSILYGARTVKQLKLRLQDYEAMKKEAKAKLKATDKKEEKSRQHGVKEQKKRSGDENSGSIKRCYNCGDKDHLSITCPSKEKGIKCFKCNEFGHIATKCTAKACVISSTCKKKKYQVEVIIAGQRRKALIDTGSDLSLISKDEYQSIGSPKLRNVQLFFEGLGSKNNKTLGELVTNITINNFNVEVAMHVVSQSLLKHKIILGENFIDLVDLHVKQGVLKVSKPEVEDRQEDNVPSVYKIDMIENDEVPDLSHIKNSQLREEVSHIITRYKPEKKKDVGIQTKIILKNDIPVASRPRRLSPVEKQEVDKQINTWLKEGIVRPSNSEYASPICLVKKKNGSTRICIDYRGINKLIERPRFPLPLIEDQLNALQSARIFSSIDLENGFFHVAIAEGSEKFTAFVTPTGQYEFLKTPFGLAISPAMFQKYIYAVFKDLMSEKVVVIYMDDVVILAEDLKEGVQRLRKTLEVASEHGLKINWRKCKFLKTEIEYLGYIVGEGIIKPSEDKTKAALNFPTPTSVKKVQSFLGLTGYFRKFLPQYSAVARPLTDLLKKDVSFVFGYREMEAFEALKLALASKPVLHLYQPGAETELHTDASRHGYGMILMQKGDEDQKFHPVYYASGKTTPAERNYTSYELEVLAIVKALKKFRVYLLGIHFKIITDCQAFMMTMKKKDLSVRVARWVLLLEEFSYEVCHQMGKNMGYVDALSIPIFKIKMKHLRADVNQDGRMWHNNTLK